MNLILLGMPGSGKGTVSSWLQSEKKFYHISTGDLLRKEVQMGSEMGQKIKAIMERGELVSDELMINLIEKHLKNMADGYSGIIFDGFPRTIEQAQALEQIVSIDKVIFLQVDEESVVNRLLNRIDVSGIKREDDNEEVIRRRIVVFYESTKTLIEYYKNKNLLVNVNGKLSIDDVRQNIARVID